MFVRKPLPPLGDPRLAAAAAAATAQRPPNVEHLRSEIASNRRIVEESRRFDENTKTCHIVRTPLNVYMGRADGLWNKSHDEQRFPKKDYIEARLEIFVKYTLRSLARQTNSDFHVIALYDKRLPLEWPTHPELGRRLHFVGIDPIDLQKDPRAFWSARADEDGKICDIAGDADRLLITYIDSDDCYRDDAMEIFRAAATQAGCLELHNGYIFNTETGEVVSYGWRSPSFFTLVYDIEQYRAGMRYQAGACNHAWVGYAIPKRAISESLYLVTTHSFNDSTTWNAMMMNATRIPPENAPQILERFGI